MKWVWRIVGGTTGLVVLCVAGLWLAGLRPGHGHHIASIEINRPAAQVWRYLTVDDLVKEWIGGLEVIRHESPGVLGAGEKVYLAQRYGGKRIEMEMTMGRVEAPHILEFTLVAQGDPSNGFSEYGGYRLEERDGKTLLTLETTAEYHGFLGRLLEPLITRSTYETLGGNLARLKALVEAKPAAAGAPPPAQSK